jgi:large conductance mechanosensitive channel
MGWVRDFRNFLMKGSLLEVAVALVIALAFTALVQALIRDLITPLIAAIFGKPDFSSLTFTLNSSTFRYGDFLNFLISFVIIAFVMFLILKFATKLMRQKAATEKDCPYCAMAIPISAGRCPECTSELPATA